MDWHVLTRGGLKTGATAKAGGLYLVDVDYPKEFGLPQVAMGPLFLPDDLN